jgi:hypothetical protein
MTSRVIAIPLSSMTSSDTIFEAGAAPAYPSPEPAAIPATNVPWPRPSPAELPGSDVMLTCATTRPPKSARPASMPESTTAIVGVAAEDPPAQNCCTPETNGQRCLFERPPARTTGESYVIESTWPLRASARIWLPVRRAATPLMERYCFRTLAFVLSKLAICFASQPEGRSAPTRITSKLALGVA